LQPFEEVLSVLYVSQPSEVVDDDIGRDARDCE
jgi:hypothetical protein